MKPWIATGLMLGLSWLVQPSSCCAQADNVFGGAEPVAPGFGEPSSAPAISQSGAQASLPEDSHAVVRSLRNRPPQSAIEISRAILYMTRIERWDEVGRYLDQLAKLAIDEPMALQMERAAGLETWFQLARNADKLNEKQRAVATKVIDLSSGSSRNPATLQAAIQLLQAKDLIDRKRGVLAIQAAGESGLAAMLESVASSDTPPVPIMSETIATMGKEGEAALKAAIATSDQRSRERLMLLAARIPGSAYMSELTTALYTVSADSEAYRQIQKVLSPAGQALPEAAASQRYVLNQMQRQLHEFSISRREITSDSNSVWRWSPDGKRLITEYDDTPGVHLERAFQLAHLAIQLGRAAGSDSPLATAVILERNHRLSPIFEREPNALRNEFLPVAAFESIDYLGLVLEAAKKAELQAAELRSIQAIGWVLPKNPANASASIHRLSESVKLSPPPLRYASAISLGKRPDQDGGFEGRFAYEQTKLEMQRLESKPLALIVGGSVELRDGLSKHLSQLGVRAIGTSSARETLRVIQEPHPIEYVFIVDRVLEMSLSELVQRIRAFPRTSSLPLAIMADSIAAPQQAIMAVEDQPKIHYSSVTTNIDLTGALLRDMQRLSPIPPMDSVDRLAYRSLVEPVDSTVEPVEKR
jgi:CheY-like chemotaxis protein